ncbi:MAG: hypothetical protein ACLVH4_02940 [Lachnospira pectinoschiza]
MKGIIYKYTSPSGKVYIGQTRCERTRRSRWFNINKPYAGPKINAARSKYDLIELLNAKESEYIQLYDSINLGYNLSSGGIPVILTEEQKRKAGDSHKRPVLVINGNFLAEYDSVVAASENLRVSAGNISLVLNNKLKQTNDYVFIFKTCSDYPKLIDTSDRQVRNRKSIGKYTLDGELICVYKSIAKAAKDNEMDRNWLAKFVKGKDNHIFRGFMWKEVHDA